MGSLKKIYVVLYPIFYMYIFRLGKHVLPITWVIAILRTYSIYAVVLTPWNKLKRAIDGLSYTPPIWCIIALHIRHNVCGMCLYINILRTDIDIQFSVFTSNRDNIYKKKKRNHFTNYVLSMKWASPHSF